mgnify:FL=1
MPNRAADIMRMMQGTMGAGGAPQRMNRLNPMEPAPSNPQMDPQAIERLMSAMSQGQGQRAGKMAGSPGRGSQYGEQMSQRQQPGTIRGISNAPPISINGGIGSATMPDFAGRGWGRGSSMGTGQVGGKFSGLGGGQEMELQQNGYTDIGDVRYILDRSTGEVTQMPRPGSGYGGGPPSNYGAQDPVTLMEAIRRGR